MILFTRHGSHMEVKGKKKVKCCTKSITVKLWDYTGGKLWFPFWKTSR